MNDAGNSLLIASIEGQLKSIYAQLPDPYLAIWNQMREGYFSQFSILYKYIREKHGMYNAALLQQLAYAYNAKFGKMEMEKAGGVEGFVEGAWEGVKIAVSAPGELLKGAADYAATLPGKMITTNIVIVIAIIAVAAIVIVSGVKD